MSIYEPAFEESLLAVPWLAISTKPPSLIKYTSHPNRPGYIVLSTDLSSVYVESLLAPGIPSRLNEISRTFKSANRRDDVEIGEDDLIIQTERALQRLAEVFGDQTELTNVEFELKNHDYHDKVLFLHTDEWSWLFNLTEIKGREPLEIISRHLLSPITEALAQSADVELKRGKRKKSSIAIDAITTALSEQRFRRLLYPNDQGKQKNKEQGVNRDEKEKTDDGQDVSLNAEEEPPLDGSEEDEYRSSPEPEPGPSPAPEKNDRTKKDNTISESQSLSTSPPRKSNSPPPRKSKKGTKDPELEEDMLPNPIQSSQKTKREREAEEDEELDRKLVEMKRKMNTGGGGRLGKRRMAR